jgi:hypothetical protein
MEHTQNTRKALTALAILAVAAGLTSCATPKPAADPGQSAIAHRLLVQAGADRYVDEMVDRAITHRFLVRESADRYVDEMLDRAVTHRVLVRESADRYVEDLVQRANATK